MQSKLFNNKKIFIFLVIFLFLIFSLANIWSQSAKKTLTISWEEWKPFMYEDNKNLTGLEIDIAKAIVELAGFTLEFQNVPWARCINMIENGKLDITMSAQKTPDREKWAYFSEPYRTEQFVLVMRKGEVKDYKLNSLKDILQYPSFHLGITRGYDYGPEFKELLKNKDFAKHLQDVEDEYINFLKLTGTRVDGLICTNIYTVTWYAQENNILDQIEIHPIKLFNTNCHMMLSKKSVTAETVSLLNQAIAKIKANGTLDKIIKKYTENLKQ